MVDTREATDCRPGFTSTTFGELQEIARQMDRRRLDGMVRLDLNVLLALLNRTRVPLADEAVFSLFYLEVVQRIKGGSVCFGAGLQSKTIGKQDQHPYT